MRKNPYIGLILLLAVSLCSFTLLSLKEEEVIWGGVTIRKSAISDFLLKKKEAITQFPRRDTIKDIIEDENKFPKHAIDTASQRILFIGDSMLEGLAPRMGAYARENGHSLHNVLWYSSSTKTWGECDTLSFYIRKYKPTYVYICLGANELFVRNIKERRKKYVSHILAQIGERPDVWIGPPNWKPDTGINEMVGNMTKPGAFFLSQDMTFDRAADGAHPTRRSAALWLDSVASWTMRHARYPILMNKPVKTQFYKASTDVLAPPL